MLALKKWLTTNFLWRKYWYWHNSQQGGPLRRREETSSHFCKVKQFRVILCNINLSTYCFYNHFLLTQLTQFPQMLLLPSSILMRDKVALLNWERSRKPYASATKNVTCFLFVLRLAKDLARTLKEGLERRFFGGRVRKHITTHPSFYTVFENHSKKSHFSSFASEVIYADFYSCEFSCLFTFML